MQNTLSTDEIITKVADLLPGRSKTSINSIILVQLPRTVSPRTEEDVHIGILFFVLPL